MNHPKSMFQLSGVHYRTQDLPRKFGVGGVGFRVNSKDPFMNPACP